MANIFKKIGIIFAVIVGICLIGLIIIFIFFPGLDVYLYAKKNCPHMDENIEEYSYYNTVVPDDFVQVKAGDLYISGPAESIQYNTGSDLHFLFRNSEEKLMVSYTSSENGKCNYDSDEMTEYNQEDHVHFFNSIGYEMPETNRDEKIFIRDGLNLEMSLHLRGKDKKIYREMTDAMEFVSEIEKLYHYQRDNVEGYICQIHPDKKNQKTTMWNADIYTGENGQTENIILIADKDPEVVKQIIASIQLAEE